jgi:hypothetical protein
VIASAKYRFRTFGDIRVTRRKYLLSGVERTLRLKARMSAFDPKQTLGGLVPHPFQSTTAGWYDALS